MNCERFRYWISLKADGRLDAPRLADLSAHLETCAGCRAFEENLEKGRAWLRTQPTRPVDESFTLGVLEEARKPRRRRRWIVPAVAAVLLIAGIAAFVIGPYPSVPPPAASATRDRAWLLLAQVANESIERPSRFEAALRDELAVARLPDPSPDLLSDAAGLIDRIRRFSRVAPPSEDMKRLQDDIRSSGLLKAWRPAGLSSSDLIIEAPTDAFRKARGLLYAGQGSQSADLLRDYLARDPDPDLQDDALYWIAFIEARRDRGPEALGALYSLWGFESKWLDPATIAEAQRMAMELAERKGAARMEIPMWMAGHSDSPPGWITLDITPDEAWCAFEGARGNKGGKDAPVAIEVKGVTYEAKNLEEFRSRHPKVVAFLQSKMPAVLKFLEEGSAEFEIEMPGDESP